MLSVRIGSLSRNIKVAGGLLMSFGAALAVPAGDARALPPDCDATMSGSITFPQLQQTLDTVQNLNYDDYPAVLKVCFAANAQVVNAANAASGALIINRDAIQLFADPGSGVAIKNLRPTGSDASTAAIIVQKFHSGFTASNMRIESSGTFGSTVWLNDGSADALSNLTIVANGLYSRGIKISSTVPSLYRSTVGGISSVSFAQASGGVALLVNSGNVDAVTNSSFTLASGSEAISTTGAQIGQLRYLSTVNGGMGGNAGQFGFSSSNIGEISDVTMSNPSGYALVFYGSKLGALQRMTVSNGSTNAAAYVTYFQASSLGVVRKLSASGYGTSTKLLGSFTGRVGFASSLQLNGSCVSPYLSNSVLDEPFGGC